MFLRRHNPRARRRGVTLLEFALGIPFMLVLVFLTIDIGRIVLVNTALHEAVTVGARAGARQGYVGVIRDSQCRSGFGGGNPTYDAFCEVARNIPGASVTFVEILSPRTTLGGGYVCQQAAGNANLYVTVRAGINVSLMTPFLANVIEGFDASNLPTTFTSTGTARCEIARR